MSEASKTPGPPNEQSVLNAESQPASDAEGSERARVVLIHQRPDLLVPCADLVNSEWQRQQAARVRWLQSSCPEFPVSLALLRGRGGAERLLGHARLVRVVGHGDGLFVESVVVCKGERGRGYGRILMEEVERYGKLRGFTRLYLTTHDKQHFYAHLGYVLSTPVQKAGTVMALVPTAMLMRLSINPSEATSSEKSTLAEGSAERRDSKESAPPLEVKTTPAAPPIPPPPPPPPPAAPHQASGETAVQTLSATPYRDAKGFPFFWMHKNI